ncbi:MAG: type II toxin-antitoxin system HipA family toxin [Bacteroidetes bacterium]|nr:type II toxin-antitoxin system HipA family toxin [Bacteroidota bacterium]
MSKNNIINLRCFDQEIGKIGYDENLNKSYFQYNPAFLKSGIYSNLFPLIFKRVEQTQVFSQYNNDTFRNLPPMIADSLPDMFGNLIFKTWLESNGFEKITALEQLAYVANRGMGALEYEPIAHIPRNTSINLDEIITVLKKVMRQKSNTISDGMDTEALINIFKIGSSAGGAQPKILISENKKSGKIIPGDVEYSNQYHHYLVKLHLDDEHRYNKCLIEYSYFLTAQCLDIEMMCSKLIDNKHFATLRYDRQNGEKQHTLTASGLTGWDFRNPQISSYENLFNLANYLKVPHHDIHELFKRMVFNVVFANADDHLKNHAFIYNEISNEWQLAPAYDMTYSLNPILNYKKSSRALSINNKRVDINREDLLKIAKENTIKNPKSIIDKTVQAIAYWQQQAQIAGISDKIISNMKRDFWN